jgi:hypothetical protein
VVYATSGWLYIAVWIAIYSLLYPDSKDDNFKSVVSVGQGRCLADDELEGWTKPIRETRQQNSRRKIMMKTISILAIAGLVLALAPTAQAALSISNPSFETPDMDGGFPSGVQPTGWTVSHGGNYQEIEARWGGVPPRNPALIAGPTDGDQVYYFDKRSGAYTASAEQSVGTVADVGEDLFRLTFDARFGGYDGSAAIEDANTNFKAYILVNGVELATWASTLGTYGAGQRLIPNITDLGSPPNSAPAPSADLMGHFSLDLDVSALTSTHDVTIGFRYEAIDDSVGNYNSRVYMDNVAVQGVPEPATMSLLAIGGLALIRRRKGA